MAMHPILLQIFSSSVLNYVPAIFFGVLLILGALRYYLKFRRGDLEGTKTARFFRKLIAAGIAFKMLYAAFLTWGQYVIWKSGGLSSILLSEPLKKIPANFSDSMPWLFDGKGGYFSFYAFNHFWLEIVVTLVLSFAFYFLLKVLQKKNPRFLTTADARLGLLGGIASGWPGFIIYLFSFALIFFILGFVRNCCLKREYTAITEPLFVAAFLGAVGGIWLISWLGFSVLRA